MGYPVPFTLPYLHLLLNTNSLHLFLYTSFFTLTSLHVLLYLHLSTLISLHLLLFTYSFTFTSLHSLFNSSTCWLSVVLIVSNPTLLSQPLSTGVGRVIYVDKVLSKTSHPLESNLTSANSALASLIQLLNSSTEDSLV